MAQEMSGSDTALRDARSGGRRGETFRDSVHYYDEYGFIMTEDGKTDVDKALSDYDNEVDSAQNDLDEARAEVDAAASKLTDDSITESWNNYASDFKLVYVYDSNGATPVSYYFPKSSLEELYSSLSGAGANVNWNADTGGMNIDTEGYGKEMHSALQSTYNTLRTSYYDKVKSEYESSLAEYEGYYKQLSAGDKALAISRQTSQEEIDNLKNKYEAKLARANKGALRMKTAGSVEEETNE